jgi:hypothetical protein
VRSQPRQSFGVGRFQIDRDAVGQLHGAFDLPLFGTGHDLEMHVPAKAMLFSQNFSRIENSVLRVRAASRDARTEEEAFGGFGVM